MKVSDSLLGQVLQHQGVREAGVSAVHDVPGRGVSSG